MQKYKLNPFMRVSFEPSLKCELLIENKQFDLPSPSFVSLFAKIHGNLTREQIIQLIAVTVNDNEAADIFSDLEINGVIVNSEYEHPDMPAVNHWIKRGWMEGLLLHLKTRNLEFSDTSGNEIYSASESLRKVIEVEGKPEIWKNYPAAPKISLPTPEEMPDKSLEEVLLYRRSNRPWRNQIMSIENFSSILHHANIETKRVRNELETGIDDNPELLLNSSFTALETYCLVLSVEGLDAGLYHYDPKNHQISLLKKGLFRDEITKCCIGQSRPHDASCVFMVSVVWDRFMFRYRHPRAYRTLLTNVAEMGQKYLLLGTSLKLSTFMTPAFNDRYTDEFMNFDGYEEAILYAVALG